MAVPTASEASRLDKSAYHLSVIWFRCLRCRGSGVFLCRTGRLCARDILLTTRNVATRAGNVSRGLEIREGKSSANRFLLNMTV